MRAALAVIGLPQLSTCEPRGAPAWWNRLISATDADVIVLLESGLLLEPGALEILAAALREPMHGASGPSTNLAWNEQGRFAGRFRGAAEVIADLRRR